jgi:hypothetical protein
MRIGTIGTRLAKSVDSSHNYTLWRGPDQQPTSPRPLGVAKWQKIISAAELGLLRRMADGLPNQSRIYPRGLRPCRGDANRLRRVPSFARLRENRSYRPQQRGRLKRFLDEIETIPRAFLNRVAARKQQASLSIEFPDLLEDAASIQTWEPEVGDDQGRRLTIREQGLILGQGFWPSTLGFDVEASHCETSLHEGLDVEVVLGDENIRSDNHSSSSAEPFSQS